MLYDSHVHFEASSSAEWDGIIERAKAEGVDRMLAVGGSEAMNTAAVDAARRFPSLVRFAVGLDRDQATDSADETQAAVDRLDADIRCMIHHGMALGGLGEIGLDFHYHPETCDAQQALFRAQLQTARALKLPVIVHSREADEATLQALEEHCREWPGSPERVGVLHCFTGTQAFAERLLALDLCISFSGIVTFRNADSLRAVARQVPDDRLLVETDTPYLAPVPCRGRSNEPAYLPHVAEKLAEVRGCSVGHIAEITRANAERLFAMKPVLETVEHHDLNDLAGTWIQDAAFDEAMAEVDRVDDDLSE